MHGVIQLRSLPPALSHGPVGDGGSKTTWDASSRLSGVAQASAPCTRPAVLGAFAPRGFESQKKRQLTPSRLPAPWREPSPPDGDRGTGVASVFKQKKGEYCKNR